MSLRQHLKVRSAMGYLWRLRPLRLIVACAVTSLMIALQAATVEQHAKAMAELDNERREACSAIAVMSYP